MSEARLWEWLRDRLPRGHATRIENEVSDGFPDVHFSLYGGGSVTLELKYSDGPKKSPLKGKIRRSQEIWIGDEVAAGGSVWIVAEVDKAVWFFHGRDVLDLSSLPLKHYPLRCDLCLPRRIVPSIAKDEIKRLILRRK